MHQYYVYILASLSRRLYTGVTNDLMRRVYQHKQRAASSFTQRYRIDRLVYFDCSASVQAAIAREKQLKQWTRARKHRLIETNNAGWRDLSLDWLM